MSRLARWYRRLTHCPCDLHRETVESYYQTLCYTCVDCGRFTAILPVARHGASNRRQRWAA